MLANWKLIGFFYYDDEPCLKKQQTNRFNNIFFIFFPTLFNVFCLKIILLMLYADEKQKHNQLTALKLYQKLF